MVKLNVALIGYQFMGRAHSNAWRQAGRFFDTTKRLLLFLRKRGRMGSVRAVSNW